jgi:hypothetical protein
MKPPQGIEIKVRKKNAKRAYLGFASSKNQ